MPHPENGPKWSLYEQAGELKKQETFWEGVLVVLKIAIGGAFVFGVGFFAGIYYITK